MQAIPNAIQYSMQWVKLTAASTHLPTATITYSPITCASNLAQIQLCYCVQPVQYCAIHQQAYINCAQAPHNCTITTSYISMAVAFTHTLLQQLVSPQKYGSLVHQVLQGSYPSAFTNTILLTPAINKVLLKLIQQPYTGSLENIYLNAQLQMLLLYSLQSFDGAEQASFSCKFLATETEVVKIKNARQILLQQIGEPLTIKALSRRVAINECYLKKGFKELYGQTIFDFYQTQRMEHAKYLLYTKGYTVTEVSDTLGYSSISHFSTAFKKLTGLKPCELFLR